MTEIEMKWGHPSPTPLSSLYPLSEWIYADICDRKHINFVVDFSLVVSQSLGHPTDPFFEVATSKN